MLDHKSNVAERISVPNGIIKTNLVVAFSGYFDSLQDGFNRSILSIQFCLKNRKIEQCMLVHWSC